MQEAKQIHPWVAESQKGHRAGVTFLDTGMDWKRFTDEAQAATDLGYDSIWIPDHPIILPDCWGQLAALAAITRTIRLGALVDCVFFRHPLALARIAGDVDRWSNGRLVLGLGIGDIPFEFEQLGVPFLSTRKRQEALEETIQILRGVWGESPFTFTGKHFQIQNAQLAFGPVQQPYIPLLIGGGGERVTLRQVAQYADASNFGPSAETGSAFTMDDVVRKNNVIATYCQTFGRTEAAVLRTHTMLPLLLGKTQADAEAKRALIPPPLSKVLGDTAMVAAVETAIDFYSALARSGMQYFIIGVAPGDIETLQIFKEQVLPAIS